MPPQILQRMLGLVYQNLTAGGKNFLWLHERKTLSEGSGPQRICFCLGSVTKNAISTQVTGKLLAKKQRFMLLSPVKMPLFLFKTNHDVADHSKLSVRLALLFQMSPGTSQPGHLQRRSTLDRNSQLNRDQFQLDQKSYKIVSEVQTADREKGRMFAYEMYLRVLVLLRVQWCMGRGA